MGARDLPPTVDATDLVRQVLREFLAPPPLSTVTEWAERCRILSSKDSSEPGPYRVERTPYAREPMDCLSQTSQVEEVILMWGAQTSKTTIGSNWLGYLVDTNPGPDIRVISALASADFVLSPIQLNQEALEGVGALLNHPRVGVRKLQAVLKGTPPPWLRKALEKDRGHAARFPEASNLAAVNSTS